MSHPFETQVKDMLASLVSLTSLSKFTFIWKLFFDNNIAIFVTLVTYPTYTRLKDVLTSLVSLTVMMLFVQPTILNIQDHPFCLTIYFKGPLFFFIHVLSAQTLWIEVSKNFSLIYIFRIINKVWQYKFPLNDKKPVLSL